MVRAVRHASHGDTLEVVLEQREALAQQSQSLSADVGAIRESLITLTEFPFTEAGRRVIDAQREITAALAQPDYRENYRREEILYWLPIPGWMLEWAKGASPGKILDIGPAYGTLSVFAAGIGAEVYCIELYDYLMAGEIIERHRITFSKRNAEKDEIPWTGLDGVVMTEVLEHFNFHPVPTLRKICDAMVPGGRLFLSTPDAASWGRVEGSYDSYHDMPRVDPETTTHDMHIYQFDGDELTEILTQSGFAIRRLERSPGRWGMHLNIEAEKPIPTDDLSRSDTDETRS
jgi:2-polyprenyl-3-methyl-5-hydroxy-6-metoxy-1,4-benzoquinol methylase